MATKEKALAQIDSALAEYERLRPTARFDDLSDLGDVVYQELDTILGATIERLAPPDSKYRETLQYRANYKVGALKALRRDYEAGYLESVHKLVRAEVFADFLEMSEHLLEQGYKDPAAVLVGGVLEEHLRSLCVGRGIAVEVSGRPKKADAMNSELAAAGVYNRLDQKNVTAWLDLRNKAAHGKYTEYTGDQVATLLSGVREFAARIAA